MTFPSGWESRLETGESLSFKGTRRWSWLIFTVCGVFLWTWSQDPIHVLNQEERPIRVYKVSVVSCHFGNRQSTVLLSSKKSLHQRRQKEMPVPIQGFQFSYPCVIMNENCFHPGCLASNPSGLHYYVDIFHIKTEHFNSWISLLCFHLISTLPPLLSGVMCNANFGEHCTPSPNQTSLIFFGLSPNRLHGAWGEERHISTFVISEWIVVFSNSMCFSRSVVGYFYCLCFCWQLSFIILRLNKDQVDSETRDHCTVGFLCCTEEAIWPPTCFSWYNGCIFNSLILYSPSSSAIQLSLWT